MRGSAALALFLMSASPAAAQEVTLTNDAQSGAKVYAEVKSGKLILKSVGPASVFVTYYFDVNNNGVVDARVDRLYGFGSGKFGTAYQLTEDSTTPSGVAVTGGSGTQEDVGNTRITTVILPISEVSNSKDLYRIKLSIWNESTKVNKKIRIKFSPNDPTAVVSADIRSIAPVTSGIRTIDVDDSMVTVEDSFLREFSFNLPLAGRKGDRFRVSWTSTVPVNNRFDYNALDADYPKGQSIFDLSRSVTLTLLTDGEHNLQFSESGVTFDPTPPGRLLAEFKGRKERAFIPYRVVVQKIN